MSSLTKNVVIVGGVLIAVTFALWSGALVGVTVLAAVLGGLAATGGRSPVPAGPVKTSRCRACGKTIARAGEHDRWRDRRGREMCDGFPHESISVMPGESDNTAAIAAVDVFDAETDTCEYCDAPITRHRRALWIDAAGEAGCGELRIHRPAR